MFRHIATVIAAILIASSVHASEDVPDQYPQSLLYSKPVEVIPHVWSAIGATAPPTYDNAGHNNNLSFIVTGEGVVVVNSGASYGLANALHDEIKSVTDQPVVLVITENGQGHAMLGNGYWADQNVPILAHVDAAEEFEDYGAQIIEGMKRYNRDKAEGTFLAGPTLTFEDAYIVEMGAFRIEERYLGPAHSPRRCLGLAARPKPWHRRRHGLSRAATADLRPYLYRRVA